MSTPRASEPGTQAPPPRGLKRHLAQHNRFYAGSAAGLCAFGLTWNEPAAIQMIAAGDAFFIVYLGLMAVFAARSTPDSTMKYARVEDEGLPLIMTLIVSAVGFSLTAIFMLLNSDEKLSSFAMVAGAVCVPLGWLTVHASVAVHYARLYYADDGEGGSMEGFKFPCDEAPDVWDFMYVSFCIATSMAMSDVEITKRPVRRFALAHSTVSYFYSTVVIALGVSAIAGG